MIASNLRLGWAESCLPAGDGEPALVLERRFALARAAGVALEAEHRAGFDPRSYRRSGLEVVALQAWEMHHWHPLSPVAEGRARAHAHALATLDIAVLLDCPRAVMICGYGHALADRPFERCLEFYSALGPAARERGVRVLIEPLSPLRVAVMNDTAEVAALVDALGRELGDPSVFGMVLDTGHLLDGGRDVERELRSCGAQVELLQLRGAGSYAPPIDWPVARWLALLPGLRALTVEHRQPLSREGFSRLAASLREVVYGPNAAIEASFR
jgi:sugar phosphate isomerase/epimerase